MKQEIKKLKELSDRKLKHYFNRIWNIEEDEKEPESIKEKKPINKK